MPQEITEIKTFLNAIQRKDAKSIKIKRNRDDVKFKLRCSKYLYTLVVKDKQIAAKLEEILPESIEIEVK
ncbi:ribosomal protein L38e [Wuchereria bancrofti]|uniref:Large ribosomal subunit protein eL38 n=1 Tax=Wuchereria bancrofti TaxID=6293 RepID=J9ETH4_WUCBA|nr:ribosomal protein L38e [Wuchereria bancrofti]VDM21974.1 unnamed protein product [Wuchereria bancrofti]